MQQEDFIRAQSAQAQVDQGQVQQQNQNMQNQDVQNQYNQDPSMQYPHVQNQYMQNPPTQDQSMQNPGMQMQDPNLQHQHVQTPDFHTQNQNQYTQQNPSAQSAYAQFPQPNPENNTQDGDFTHDGHTYNIHRIHALIHARHLDSSPPSNRGANAFSLPSHGAYGLHSAPPRPQPRLGPNGRPMIKLEGFGHTGEWVEMPDLQAYRRDTEENRAERERNMAADLESIERNPHRLGATWRPVWRRW